MRLDHIPLRIFPRHDENRYGLVIMVGKHPFLNCVEKNLDGCVDVRVPWQRMVYDHERWRVNGFSGERGD